MKLPEGFEQAPRMLAFGGELKATFCMTAAGEAVLSAHHGDLEDVETYDAYRRDLLASQARHAWAPEVLIADCHPDYLSSKLARERASECAVPLIEVQHHHAHVAACLAENGRPLGAAPVLGIVLDGLGWGDDGTIWGGEFLLADYHSAQRIGTFKPVAMPGGSQAAREPWRNLYAHLMATMTWTEFTSKYGELAIARYLDGKPRAVVDAMLRKGINSPLASSCGRLFDAVAAAVGIRADRQAFEGQAACELEALSVANASSPHDAVGTYPFALARLPGSHLPYVEPAPMWRALLDDLVRGAPLQVISECFHRGLAEALVEMAAAHRERFDTVVLSGGCFCNKVLAARTAKRLEERGMAVLMHSRVPTGDGGLALGQAAIGAARVLARAAG